MACKNVCSCFQLKLFRNGQNYFPGLRHIQISSSRPTRWPKGKQSQVIGPRITQTPFQHLHIENNPTGFSSLWKPFIFTLSFSGISIAGCAIWQYESMRNRAMNMIKNHADWVKDHILWRQKAGKLRQTLNEQWSSLSQGQKVFVPICFANILVFLAWRIRRFQPTMVRYFCSNPGSSVVCLPMVLSTFSHISFFHIAANMYVLHSFCTTACSSLGMEQFVALYLSAGVISSFSSLAYKIITSQSGLSIGASGAIMAVLGYVCCEHPDIRLSIILLPMYTFTAGVAIKFILGLDLTGVVLGWKFFDHAAHLGGALGGMAWCYWGTSHIWKKRESFLNYWHQFRSRDN